MAHPVLIWAVDGPCMCYQQVRLNSFYLVRLTSSQIKITTELTTERGLGLLKHTQAGLEIQSKSRITCCLAVHACRCAEASCISTVHVDVQDLHHKIHTELPCSLLARNAYLPHRDAFSLSG